MLETRNYLPDCWQDDKRMEVLFSPFRARESNPEGWDIKMSIWINIINKWCIGQRKIVFNIHDIRLAFQRGDRRPSIDCLKLVLSQMKREQKILFKEDMPTQNQKTLTKIAIDLTFNSLNYFFKPVSYIWNAMSHNENDPNEKILTDITIDTIFFNKDTMDILLSSTEKWMSSLKPGCLSYQNFHNLINEQLFNEQPIDSQTLDVIIQILECKNILTCATKSGIRIVKYGNIGYDCEIRDIDIALVKLDLCKDIIQSECSALNSEMSKLQIDARETVENKNREKAVLILKKKKRFEAKLIEKDIQIDNIETLYQQIIDSHSQQAIMDAFQVANSVLKNKNSNKIAEIEKVEKIVLK